jgi:hypothetical protein
MTSEGTKSAQRINASLTGDPLLLHRVDASQLQAPVHVVNGAVEQRGCTHDCNQGRNCTCRPVTERKPGLWKSWRW